MSAIVLCTLNSRYHHSSFGLRYLFANLNELQGQAQIAEYTISQNTRDITESILAKQPKLVGFGVYIWNTKQTYEVVSIIKKVAPEIKIVLGGPEVSHESESQEICQLADLTIKGEADFAFYEVCRSFLNAGAFPITKFLSAELPEISKLKLPYGFYSNDDIKNRVIYVEASRGCPYKCEYCLSSLDKSVRSFDTDLFLAEMQKLIENGVRQFKFIDRTFNLSISTSRKILQFFLDQMVTRTDVKETGGLFLHFEMVPDRLPEELRDLIDQFPHGSLQFEVGIQTWNPEVARLVSRRQDYQKIKDNFAYLAEKRNVHTHADLIAGLPSETLESFAKGFDAVAELAPDEIQVGILKRLKGTPIIRHDLEWGMVYQDQPPFQILKTKTMSYETLQQIGRFSNFWDSVANSGNFNATMGLLKEIAKQRTDQSLYFEFNELVLFLSKRHPVGHSVALLNLLESVYLYLRDVKNLPIEIIKAALVEDYTGTQKRDLPKFLRNVDADIQANIQTDRVNVSAQIKNHKSALPQRQQRHKNTVSNTVKTV